MLTSEQAMQEAVTHHQAGRLREAQQLYQAVLKAQPGHGPANHNMGVLAVQGSAFVAALPYFRQAVLAEPAQGAYWISYIDALIQAGHPAVANDVLARARRQGLKGMPADALAARISVGDTPEANEMNSLILLFNEGRYEELEETARVLAQLYPDQGLVWKLWGAARAARGDQLLSLEPLQQAAIWMPSDADVRVNLGNALKAHGRLAEAEAAYHEAIALQPESAHAQGALGNLLRQQRKPAQAQACYERALALQPTLVGARQNLGVVFNEQGRLDEAEASYEAALAARPDFMDACINLATLLQNTGRVAQAQARLEQGLQPAQPDSWMLASLMLAGYWLQGDFSRAEALATSWAPIAQAEQARRRDTPLREFFVLTARLLAARSQQPQLYAGDAAGPALEVLGESHCLAAAHAGIDWTAGRVRGRSRLVKGAKMYHLGQPEANQYKASLARQLDALQPGASLLLTIGEFDCRPNEGIWHAFTRGKGAMQELVPATTQGYLAWLQAEMPSRELAEVTVQGIPAPACGLDAVGDRSAYLAMVREVNAQLKAGAAARGWRFLDVYGATASDDGTSNRRWHIDEHHLHPAFYAQARQWLV